MTGLFKCVVLSCAVSLVFCFTSVRDDVNWFKNGERLKNRFVTGVVNGIVDLHCSDQVTGENVEGECLPKVECNKSGGKVGGLCSLLGSCCVIEKTCQQTTSSKLSYFVPPKQFQNNCPLTINKYSKDVCQIRLDFIRFEIAPPTKKSVNEKSSFQCYNDAFTVENVKKKLGFPHLCGQNAGQHIYIPVAENQDDQIIIRFTLHGSIHPDWRIKIRQLECPNVRYEHLNAPSKLMTMYNNLKNKKQPRNDLDLLAPPNCLQYYYNRTGTFESFNYNAGNGFYIGGLDYAVCFRTEDGICSAKYTADGKFQMNFNPNNVHLCHPPDPATAELSQDYIRIPGGINDSNYYYDHFCGTDLEGHTVYTKSLEPLFVGVHTDSYHVGNETEIGFRIQYNLLSDNCDNNF